MSGFETLEWSKWCGISRWFRIWACFLTKPPFSSIISYWSPFSNFKTCLVYVKFQPFLEKLPSLEETHQSERYPKKEAFILNSFLFGIRAYSSCVSLHRYKTQFHSSLNKPYVISTAYFSEAYCWTDLSWVSPSHQETHSACGGK